jgi:hypothetical protein
MPNPSRHLRAGLMNFVPFGDCCPEARDFRCSLKIIDNNRDTILCRSSHSACGNPKMGTGAKQRRPSPGNWNKAGSSKKAGSREATPFVSPGRK